MVLGTMAFGGNADIKAPASYFDLFPEAGGNGSTLPMATPGGEQSGRMWWPILAPVWFRRFRRKKPGEVPTDYRIPVWEHGRATNRSHPPVRTADHLLPTSRYVSGAVRRNSG
jgi:hypothetical protein